MTEDLFPSAPEPANVSQEGRISTTSPTPWRVEHQRHSDGWSILSIRDAEGHYIVNMIPHPGDDDRHRRNAKMIVEAVNKQNLRGLD